MATTGQWGKYHKRSNVTGHRPETFASAGARLDRGLIDSTQRSQKQRLSERKRLSAQGTNWSLGKDIRGKLLFVTPNEGGKHRSQAHDALDQTPMADPIGDGSGMHKGAKTPPQSGEHRLNRPHANKGSLGSTFPSGIPDHRHVGTTPPLRQSSAESQCREQYSP